MTMEMTSELNPEMIPELTGDQAEIGDPDGCPLTHICLGHTCPYEKGVLQTGKH